MTDGENVVIIHGKRLPGTERPKNNNFSTEESVLWRNAGTSAYYIMVLPIIGVI